MNVQKVEQIVRQALLAIGWNAHPGRMITGTAVALKTYATAVGPKEAQAYVQNWGEGRFTLTGQYYSEGNNALATTLVSISADLSELQIASLAREFAERADSCVSQTYAARLLGPGLAAPATA